MKLRVTKAEVALFAIIVAIIIVAFVCGGCAWRETLADAGKGAAEGAASGAVTGGPWGAVIGGGLGLLLGLGKALHSNRQKNTVLADVTRGVGSFLDEALDPADFAGLNAEQAMTLAKQKLRDSLSSHMTDYTRAEVRRVKDANG